MYHKKVKAQEFQIGDLILKHVIWSIEVKNMGKLVANWEGAYTVIAKGDKGSYILIDQDRKILDKQ